MEDLPDEIWLKIMEYLPISDILRTMAPVSKKFYRLSRDKNLIKQIEFKSIMNTVKWQKFWSEERKNKYFNDFFDVLKNAHYLKCLSLHLDNPSAKKFYENLIQSSVNYQCLENFCIQFGDMSDCSVWELYFPIYIWNFHSQCPKLKTLKIGGCLSKLTDLLTILQIIASFSSHCLQEIDLNISYGYANFHELSKPDVRQSLKDVLKKMAENFPSMKKLCLALNFEIYQMLPQIYQEIASEQNINIEIRKFKEV